MLLVLMLFFSTIKIQIITADETTTYSGACNEDQLISFLAEIQAINPENIIHLTTIQEMDNLCQKVEGKLTQIQTSLKACKGIEQKDLYVQLVTGVETLHKKMCKDKGFRKEFESHVECYRQLESDYEDCVGPADWTENSEPEKVCSAYKEISDCYYVKTAKVCGIPAAKTMKELLKDVINSIITVKCGNVNKNPKVESIETSNSPIKVAHNIKWTYIYTFIVKEIVHYLLL